MGGPSTLDEIMTASVDHYCYITIGNKFQGRQSQSYTKGLLRGVCPGRSDMKTGTARANEPLVLSY